MKVGEIWELKSPQSSGVCSYLDKVKIKKLYEGFMGIDNRDRVEVAPIDGYIPSDDMWIADMSRQIFLSKYKRLYEDR